MGVHRERYPACFSAGTSPSIYYYGYDDRRHGVLDRPWNGLGLNGDTDSYRFVEIPIHNSITTIVGANESGKSHLLSAISKVITGVGIPDDREESRFDVTDLCHLRIPASQSEARGSSFGFRVHAWEWSYCFSAQHCSQSPATTKQWPCISKRCDSATRLAIRSNSSLWNSINRLHCSQRR